MPFNLILLNLLLKNEKQRNKTYNIADIKTSTPKEMTSGAKLANAEKTAEINIENSITGRLPCVSASQPQKYDVKIIAGM